MKHGDLVRVPGIRRHLVCLRVTKLDILSGLNVRRPGLALFGGYWYREEVGGPLKNSSYGKVYELSYVQHPGCRFKGPRVVGRVVTAYGAFKTR